MDDGDKLRELERAMDRVNEQLRTLLPLVQDPAFTDSDVRKGVREAEFLSRWRRYTVEGSGEPLDHAKKRAKELAEERGIPYIVAEKDDLNLIIMPEVRLKDRPFGLGRKHVVFSTDKGGK